MKNVFLNGKVRIAAVLACGICAVRVIQAFNPQPDPPGFGMIGITPESQYARLNVSNVAIPGTGFGGSCQVELAFGDGQGRTFKQTLVTLDRGKSVSLDVVLADLRATNSVDVGPARVELLPAVSHEGSCALVSSGEVVGITNGQTSAYAAHAALTANHNETLVRDSDSQ